jgi:hypothetical protein
MRECGVSHPNKMVAPLTDDHYPCRVIQIEFLFRMQQQYNNDDRFDWVHVGNGGQQRATVPEVQPNNEIPAPASDQIQRPAASDYPSVPLADLDPKMECAEVTASKPVHRPDRTWPHVSVYHFRSRRRRRLTDTLNKMSGNRHASGRQRRTRQPNWSIGVLVVV